VRREATVKELIRWKSSQVAETRTAKGCGNYCSLLVCRATGYNRDPAKAFSNHRAERYFEKVVLLILESLGSTELMFILVMALVFFGPRKLPQLSRTLGKNLANFRRASEDFKRTWEKEVNQEEFTGPGISASPAMPKENSILAEASEMQPVPAPTIEAVAADRIIPRQPTVVDTLSERPESSDQAEPSRKHDWL
jgi:TatA/E family protein of Tat protein translocase